MGDAATVYVDVSAEVEIPDAGTLSRVRYADSQVRLVVFAVDAQQEMADHAAGVPAVVQVMSGRLELTSGGDVAEVGPRILGADARWPAARCESS